MKLKHRIEKYRDEKALEVYWSSPERYNIEVFKIGFNSAIEFILAQPEIKNMEEVREMIKKIESV